MRKYTYYSPSKCQSFLKGYRVSRGRIEVCGRVSGWGPSHWTYDKLDEFILEPGRKKLTKAQAKKAGLL